MATQPTNTMSFNKKVMNLYKEYQNATTITERIRINTLMIQNFLDNIQLLKEHKEFKDGAIKVCNDINKLKESFDNLVNLANTVLDNIA